jgi:hypothetical protein
LQHWLGGWKKGGWYIWFRREASGKRKDLLIKYHIARYINASSGPVKALVSFVFGTISKKSTLSRAEGEFMVVIRAQIWPACAPKRAQESVVGLLIEEAGDRCRVLKSFGGHSVNEVTCSEKGFVPITNWERRMGKKGNARLDKMAVFAFSDPILLGCMGAGHAVKNAFTLEIRRKASIFASTISLHSSNFSTKKEFNMFLEEIKGILNI